MENTKIDKRNVNVVITAKVIDCEVTEHTKKDGSVYYKRVVLLKGFSDGIKAKFSLTDYIINKIDAIEFKDGELISFVPVASYKDPLSTIEIKGRII